MSNKLQYNDDTVCADRVYFEGPMTDGENPSGRWGKIGGSNDPSKFSIIVDPSDKKGGKKMSGT